MDITGIMQQLAACMGSQDKVLLCCAGEDARLLVAATSEASIPAVSWEPDLRWQHLAKLALLNRTRVAIGSAEVLLGLSKLAKATSTPFPIRKVLLIGPACPVWIKEMIARGLDAEVWDYGVGECAPNPLPIDLQQDLLRWSSVLDYRVEKTEMGLSLELVVFPGKLLPKLPSGAKVTVRPWVPAADKPFSVI